MKKIWKVKEDDKELAGLLCRELNLHPLTSKLLINRGFRDIESAISFLSPDIKDLHDPALMKDMGEGVDRLIAAIEGGEKIAIYGDYDVDGITSTALLSLFLRELGTEVKTYIPERLGEGYGLNVDAISNLAEEGVTLIITTDCGVSNIDEVAFASTLGVDVIITDHHVTPPQKPIAVAILNPRQPDCGYPFKGLAGVGVAFHFCMAIRVEMRSRGFFDGHEEPNLKNYLDLVCIGTVADMVPLVDENRVLVKYGLEVLKSTDRPGLKALKSASGVRDEHLSTESISFQLAPRINAAGRIGRASTALELLTTTDEVLAGRLAYELDQENSNRQRLEAGISREATSMLDLDSGDRGIVLSSENWHPGVIGIVASRLVNRFSMPTVMIAIEGEIGRGSARGVTNFDILEGIKSCSEYLDKFGGHKAAAGFTIHKSKIEDFTKAFLDNLNATLTSDDLTPEIVLDAVISLDEIDMRLVSEIERLSPFGISNREPLLCAEDAHIVYTEIVGEKHLRLKARHKGEAIKGIAFGLGDMHPMKGHGFDLAFRPCIDTWTGKRDLKLMVKDVKATLA